jgi:hypothetical protein
MWTPGEWQHVTGKIVPCENGLHVVTASQALEWIGPNMVVWNVETDSRCRHMKDERKTVLRRARITELTAWKPEYSYLLAADFAERVLPMFEQRFPGDDRPRKAIETVRQMASVFTVNEDDEEVEAIRNACVAQANGAALTAWNAWAFEAIKTARAIEAAGGSEAAIASEAAEAIEDARAICVVEVIESAWVIWPASSIPRIVEATVETARAAQAARAAWAAVEGRASWAAEEAREAMGARVPGMETAAAEEREWQVSRMLDYFNGDAP